MAQKVNPHSAQKPAEKKTEEKPAEQAPVEKKASTSSLPAAEIPEPPKNADGTSSETKEAKEARLKINRAVRAKAKRDLKAVKLVAHPALTGADGKPVKLKAIPTDYKTTVHLPLKRDNFESDAMFFELMAIRYEEKAKEFRLKATEAAKVGNVADKARAKRLLKAQAAMVNLRKELEAQGINVDELLAANAALTAPKE